jgi:hypothetical protein
MNPDQIQSLTDVMDHGEQVIISENVFSINWYPNPHKRGVDLYPVISHNWLALTTFGLRSGCFNQTEKQLSRSDRTKWAWQVPRYLTKPVDLGSQITESFSADFTHITDIRTETLELPAIVVNDYQHFMWYQVPWQFGDAIASHKIDRIRLHSLFLSYAGDELTYFCRTENFEIFAEELSRRCNS